MTDYFTGVAPLAFDGPDSDNPLSYRHSKPGEMLGGKTMEEHLRFAVAWWHSFAWPGGDPFGGQTFDRPWFGDTMDLATEEHEAEAEEAEHEEIAEHEGGVASHGGGGGGDDAGKHADEVRRRVLEMFADAARDSLERGGSPFRRP